jgi:membrane associated rhomboid family serine protease
VFILPIERDNPVCCRPYVVQVLLGINVVAFVVSGFGASQHVAQRFGFLAASPHISTLFSHMFLHAGFLHLLGNMFFLWMFGDNVEDVLGHTVFLISYLVCGIGAAFGQYLSAPHSAVPMVGASGAISGVMALYIVFFPRSRFDLEFYLGWWRVGSKPATSKTAVLVWFCEQLLLGALSSATHSIGIAFWAHVAGFVTGLALAGVLVLFGWRERYEVRIYGR